MADLELTQGVAIAPIGFTATGGVAPYSWTVTGLPPGLTHSAGVISGTPTTPGSYTIAVLLSDGAAATASTSIAAEVRSPALAVPHYRSILRLELEQQFDYSADVPIKAAAAAASSQNSITFDVVVRPTPAEFAEGTLTIATSQSAFARRSGLVAIPYSYVGDGQGTLPLNGMELPPDWIWIKKVGGQIRFFDTLRGGQVVFNKSGGESTIFTPAGGIQKFDLNGITVGGDFSVNEFGVQHRLFAWRRGPGLDIVAYTGNGATSQAIAHNLGDVPEMMWVFRRGSSSTGMTIYHLGGVNPASNGLSLQNQARFTTANWGNTAPTATQFTVGGTSAGGLNVAGGSYIAYLMRSVSNRFRVGAYLGSGAANNAINIGFEPSALFIKRGDTVSRAWIAYDRVRSPSNPRTLNLDIDDRNGGETNLSGINFTPTGFTLLTTSDSQNQLNANYCYFAF